MNQLYDNIFLQGKRSVLSGKVFVDPYLCGVIPDKRLAISLLIPVQVDFSEMIRSLQSIEPLQYFYPTSDFHITLQELVTGMSQFEPGMYPVEDYIRVLDKVLKRTPLFKIAFRGVTMSDGAVLVQGFCDDIQPLRAEIRANLRDEGLQITERYAPKIAHVTIMRFCRPLQNPQQLVGWVDEWRGAEIGSIAVNAVELNILDLYNRKERRQVLANFPLLTPP